MKISFEGQYCFYKYFSRGKKDWLAGKQCHLEAFKRPRTRKLCITEI